MKKRYFLTVVLAFLIAMLLPVLGTAAGKKTPTIKLNKKSVTFYQGESCKLKATVTGTRKKVSWKSSRSSVVSVSSSGKLKAKKQGTATIKATCAGKSASCTVKVKKPTILLDRTSASIKKDSSFKLHAAVKGASKKVAWSTSNSKVATVKNGLVKGIKAGTVTITAKANGVKVSCKVKVEGIDYAKLYKAFLQKSIVMAGNTKVLPGWFYVINIDKSGVPELVIADKYSSTICTYYVYTVKSNKVTYLGSCTAKGMGVKPYLSYCSAYKSLYVSGWINSVGGVWGADYAISGSKLVRKYFAVEYMNYDMRGKVAYFTATNGRNEKKTSKSSYVSFVNKYMNPKKIKKYNMLSNTSTNRNKIK